MAQAVRAAVLVKPKTIELREFPRPAIGSEDALLRIEACGICGSDYEQYEGAAPQHEDYTQYPVIPGHEPLGLIEEIGALARARWGVTEGDRVAVRSGYGCGRCAACARFESRACRTRGGTYGYTDVTKPPHLWGGYAEHMYLCPHSVVKKMALPGSPWVSGKDSMVSQGGNDHARHRAVSIPVGLEVAVDREPCGAERHRAVRGGVG